MSTKREVLDNILSHYEIIIDNPMSILTQDAARSFLTSTSTSKIYRYLSEGIQHETWKAKNIETITNNNGSKTHLRALHTQVKELAEKKDEAENEYKARRHQEDSQLRLRTLKGKLAWKQVEVEEKQRDQFQSNLDEYERQADEYGIEAEHIRQGAEVFKDSEAELKAEMDAKTAEYEDISQELHTKESELRQLKSQRSDADQAQKSLQRQIDDQEAKTLQLQEKLEEEDRNLSGGYDEMKRQMREKLDENKTLYQSVLSKLESAQEEMKELQEKKESFESKIAETQKGMSSYDSEIAGYNQNIKQQNDKNHNHLSAFGPNTEKLLREIDKNASRFKEKPIGPIGRYVSLKIPVWGSILNQQLARTLSSFVVSCDEDKNTLFRILRSFGRGMNHAIIVTQVDLFDYRDNLPDPKFTTVLDALEISDEHIKRVLINQNRIESTILVENRSEAEELMYPTPPKVSRCYSLTNGIDGCIVGGGDGNSSGSTPIYGWKKQSLLKAKSSDLIDQWKQRLELAKRSRNEIAINQQQLLTERNHVRGQISKIGNAIVQYKERRKKIRKEIDDLEQDLSEEVDMSRRNTLEMQIEECNDQKAKYEQQHTDSIILRQQFDEEIRLLGKELEAIKTRAGKAMDEVNLVEKKIASLNNDQLQSNYKIAELQRKQMKAKGDMNAMQRNIDEANASIAKITEAAQRYSEERITSEETIDQLIEQAQQTTIEIRALESGNVKSLEQVSREFQEAHMQWKSAKDNFSEVKALVKKFHTMQAQRETQYQHFLRLATGTICGEFNRILSERNFEGYLKIDHVNEKIELYAAPRSKHDDAKSNKSLIKQENKTGRDPRLLSGGEKSFSQIAFLLAVWKCMGSKVRGLDEFDVFMDDVNRQQSMKLMIEAVKSSSNVQTIFITPNNMTNTSMNDEDVRIHLMADPR